LAFSKKKVGASASPGRQGKTKTRRFWGMEAWLCEPEGATATGDVGGAWRSQCRSGPMRRI